MVLSEGLQDAIVPPFPYPGVWQAGSSVQHCVAHSVCDLFQWDLITIIRGRR
jgi:hypothetical protein